MHAGRPGLLALALAFAAVATGACYAPTAGEGAPCAANGDCPTGQTCDPLEQRCFAEVRTVDAAPADDAPPLVLDDAPPPVDAGPTVWRDLFERPDGTAVGNGWIEKAPLAFRLADGHVVKNASGTDYRDNLVYRPASEATADVTAQVVVLFTGSPIGHAQVFVRGQPSTIGEPNVYDGYLLYVDVDGRVVLGRQHGDVFVETLEVVVVSSAFVPGVRYRLTLSVRETSPVVLAGQIERATNGGWASIGEIAAQDAAPDRITAPGSVGFSGSSDAAYQYEEFVRIAP